MLVFWVDSRRLVTVQSLLIGHAAPRFAQEQTVLDHQWAWNPNYHANTNGTSDVYKEPLIPSSCNPFWYDFSANFYPLSLLNMGYFNSDRK